MMETKPSIAVLIPCYNEELTIEKVVRGFSRGSTGCNSLCL